MNRYKKRITLVFFLLCVALLLGSYEAGQHNHDLDEAGAGTQHSLLCPCKTFHQAASGAHQVAIVQHTLSLSRENIFFQDVSHIINPFSKIHFRRGPPSNLLS